MIYESNSEQETFEIGKMLGEKAEMGMIFALEGDLGVGKTAFSKGFAEGLGITEVVNSPTFTIVQVYDSGRMPLYHFDAYRIEDPSEMDYLGFDEYFFGNGAVSYTHLLPC